MWPQLKPSYSELFAPAHLEKSFKPKALVFDVGNVLIDLNWNAFFEALEKAQNPEIKKPNGENISQKLKYTDLLSRMSSVGLLKQWSTGRIGPADFTLKFNEILGYDAGSGLSVLEIKQMSSLIVGSVRTGVVPFLKSLRQKGYILAVLSNAVPWHETDIRKTICLEEIFDIVAFSQDFGYEKPDLNFYSMLHAELEKIHAQRAQHRQPLGKNEVFFVDDLPENIIAAKNFGWNASLLLLLSPEKQKKFLNCEFSADELLKLSNNSSEFISGAQASQALFKIFEGL
jgi:FMN phosphatase YigB (HAD superfamily)